MFLYERFSGLAITLCALLFCFFGSIRRRIVEVSYVYEKLIYKLNVVKVKVTCTIYNISQM